MIEQKELRNKFKDYTYISTAFSKTPKWFLKTNYLYIYQITLVSGSSVVLSHCTFTVLGSKVRKHTLSEGNHSCGREELAMLNQPMALKVSIHTQLCSSHIPLTKANQIAKALSMCERKYVSKRGEKIIGNNKLI